MLKLTLYILIGFLCVGILWFYVPQIVVHISKISPSEDVESLKQLGPFGDSFGVINSLFTGLALAAIVSAIIIQTQQLHKQDESLQIQRREFARAEDQSQKEDDWKRLQLQFELLPSVCRRATFRLRQLCDKLIEIDKNFYESPEGIQSLLDQFDRRIQEKAPIIKMHQTSLVELRTRQAEKSAEVSNLPLDERAEFFMKSLNGDVSDPNYSQSIQEIEKKLRSEEEMLSTLRKGRTIVEQIRLHQERLDAAYEKAVMLQSDLNKLN